MFGIILDRNVASEALEDGKCDGWEAEEVRFAVPRTHEFEHHHRDVHSCAHLSEIWRGDEKL